MVSLIGTFTLASAVICSLFSVIGFFLSLISKNRSNFYNRNARILNYLSAFSILAAFIVLEVGLFQRDYSIQYVYEHTANSTSKLFTFTGVWAGLEQLDACALFSLKAILGNADSLNHTGLPIQSIGKTEISSD